MQGETDAPGYLKLYHSQGLPGAPNNLRFSDITMSSLMVSWDRPKKRNGEIIGYIVSYETAEQNERKYSNSSCRDSSGEDREIWIYYVSSSLYHEWQDVYIHATQHNMKHTPTLSLYTLRTSSPHSVFFALIPLPKFNIEFEWFQVNNLC